MINSLARGLQALTLMAQAEGPLGVTELAEALGVDPSSSYRLLATLEEHGFVRQETQGKKYALSYAALDLANAVIRRLDVAKLAGPHLRRLVTRTGESAHLAVRDDTRAVFVAQERATAILRVDTALGSFEPVHCTAVGKALLADFGEADLDALFPDGTLPRQTSQTITSLNDLQAELARTRARGYAYDDEEMHPGVRCLAAPVRNHHGEIVASAGISGPTTRLTRERLPDLAAAVCDAADAISAEMGYTTPAAPVAREHAG